MRYVIIEAGKDLMHGSCETLEEAVALVNGELSFLFGDVSRLRIVDDQAAKGAPSCWKVGPDGATTVVPEADTMVDLAKAEELYQKGRTEMGVGGLKDAALRYLTESIQADPTHADAYEARSNVYISMDRIDEGMADMKKSCELAKQSGVRLRDNAIG